MPKKKRGNLFFNIMTSGKRFDSEELAQMDMTVRYILLNSMIFLGGSLLFLFGYQSLRVGATLQGIFDISMGITTLVAFVLLRTRAPYLISGFLTVVSYMCLCAFLAKSGGVQGSGVLWAYSFPLLSIFLTGMRAGTLLSAGLGIFVGVSVLLPGFADIVYERSFALRTVGVYLLVLACTMVYEKTKIEKDRRLASLNRSLKSERDEIKAMKDNLKDGIFLMDRNLIIQPSYSPVMESIMDCGSLSGRNFLDLLKNSLQQKEQDTLSDYFGMVIDRSFDAGMLEDINPLQELTYYSTDTKEQRTLSLSFAPVDREDGSVYLLGTVKDKTVEAALARQLSEEENKRQEEMKALFEVIHVEPGVLNDFIEDTEYEFDRINDLLKDKSRSSHSVMIEIYQALHAVKANAVILGLGNFSAKLHELEREISELREKLDISFQEVLHITVELDKIFKAKDNFKELVDKIRSFKFGEGRLQEQYVLVQTLEKVIEKTSNDLGKKARLNVTALDVHALELTSRRLLKEVLVQLVRNSMYHGIEVPADRLRKGKEELGMISLSIALADGKVVIQLSDDGGGLQFERIREKAVAQGLLTADTPVTDRNALLQVLFAPGFSTASGADMHAGRGIGLNLVRDRIKEAKGTIKLQSEEDKGTVFKIYIPAEAFSANATQSA